MVINVLRRALPGLQKSFDCAARGPEAGTAGSSPAFAGSE